VLNFRRGELRIAALVTAMCVLVNVPQSFAQAVAARIVGTIRDSSGAVIPGVMVSAKNLESGAERTTISDESGNFIITNIPAGSYEVTASAAGFQKEVRSGVTLTVGAAQRLDFTLNVGTVAEQVVVTGEAAQVDTTTSTMSGLVAETTIRELPLNGRDWLQLGALQSGVLIGLSKNPDFGENVTHGGGMFMSISGGRPTSNVFMVDGLVINDHANKSPGSALGVNLGVDAIREFSVLTSTYSAEYGRSSGGVINAITKGGTNNIHGTAFYFGRNSALDARNFFDGATIPPFRRHQFGGAVGGPIKTDKLFFFANYESLRQFLSESFAYDTLSPNARKGILTDGPVNIDPRIAPYLAFFPVGNGPINGNTQKYLFGAGQLGIEHYLVGRVDFLSSANTTIYGTYTFDTSHANAPDAYNDRLIGDKGRNQRFTLSVQHTFSPTLLNTFNVGLARVVGTGNIDAQGLIPAATDKSLGFFPGQNSGSFTIPELSTPTNVPGGFGSTGGDSVWYTAPQFNDNLTFVKGRHNIRTGFSVEAIRDNIDVGHNPLGDWTFNSIHDFLTGTPNLFASAVPGKGAYRGVREKIFGLYVQDDLRVRSNLTLNLGVRYEPATVLSEAHNLTTNLHHLWDAQQTAGQPMYQNPTLHNFAPRVGLAWDPKGDGKTSVRAGFGIFNVLPLPNLLSGNLNHTLPFYLNATVVKPPVSTFPNKVQLSFDQGSGYYMQYDPPQAYKEQWNLNIERQITTGLSITAGYVGSRGVHLPLRYGDLNLVPTFLVTKTQDGHLKFPSGTPQRVNPNFPLIPATLWNAYSIYQSGQINITQRFTHGVTFQGVYVWSKNIDVGSSEVNRSDNFNNVDNPYPFMPILNRGLADWDVPHHAALNAVWDLPNPSTQMAVPRFLLSGWELGGIYTVQSGMPFSATIAADRAGTGTGAGNGNGQRPDYNPAPGCSTNAINPGHPDNYIKLQCFSFPAPGTLGNLGRNTMRAPSMNDFDFSLFKNHNLIGEKLKLQFRAEAFNLFNRTNFGARAASLINGRSAYVPGNAVLKSPTVTTSRQIQFGTKLIW
jgi:Carboxypeptidase regulatory-like domain/TonB dependent receptor/TonB-dependent Receptor Plug Domain